MQRHNKGDEARGRAKVPQSSLAIGAEVGRSRATPGKENFETSALDDEQ